MKSLPSFRACLHFLSASWSHVHMQKARTSVSSRYKGHRSRRNACVIFTTSACILSPTTANLKTLEALRTLKSFRRGRCVDAEHLFLCTTMLPQRGDWGVS